MLNMKINSLLKEENLQLFRKLCFNNLDFEVHIIIYLHAYVIME